MKYSVSGYIKKLEKREKQAQKYMKTLGLELKGHLQRNISTGKITPKTDKPKGKTLYDKGTGLKNIDYKVESKKIKFGDYMRYMGLHNLGYKDTVTRTSKNGKKSTYLLNIPQRKWLFWSKEAKKVIQAWIIDLWK